MSNTDRSSNDKPRRFGHLPREAMDAAQLRVNDDLIDYLYPDRSGTGATIGGPMDALLRSPVVAEKIGYLVPTMFDDLAIPRSVGEVAILVTAREWNSDFEFHTHRRYAHGSGVPLDVIDTIEEGRRPSTEPDLQLGHDFALQLLRSGDVENSTFADVVSRWGERGALDLTVLVGFYSLLAMVLNVDHTPAEGGTYRLPPKSDDRHS